MIMNCIILVAVVLSLLSLSRQQSSARLIYVNKKGTDGQKCLQGNTSHLYQPSVENSCQTIEYVADHTGNEFEDLKIIVITDVKVSSTVRFQGGNKVTIIGKNRPTKLSCNCHRKLSVTNGGGFTFVNVQQIQIYGISFVNCCGSLKNRFKASLVIKKSSNVSVEGVTIRHNEYNSGMILIDSSSVISIINSSFIENSYKIHQPASLITAFAAGVHMQFSENRKVHIFVLNCHFEGNRSPDYRILDPGATKGQVNLNGYSLGGGMGVVFMQQSNGTVIEIHNTTFKKNTAKHGGGLCVHFQGEPSNNNVTVKNSVFIDNKSFIGGGALKLSFGLNQSAWTQNHLWFTNITFERNSATFGGGLSVSTLLTNRKHVPGDTIRFENCTWRGNFGLYGAAIELSPFRFQQSRQLGGYLPIPLFKDCIISDHFMRSVKPNSVLRVTQGVLLSHALQYTFKEDRFSETTLTLLSI